jgi:excisionase family DNA binding protein
VAPQRKDNGDQPPSYLRTAEVAAWLHVSPKTVARWAKEGKLPFMRTLGGHRRYPEAKLRQLVGSAPGGTDGLSWPTSSIAEGSTAIGRSTYRYGTPAGSDIMSLRALGCAPTTSGG